MRKTAALAILLASCGKPPASQVPLTFQEPINWHSLERISSPSDFAPLEPILEGLTGREPVRSKDVHFVSEEELKGICMQAAKYGGCYAFGKIAFDHTPDVSTWMHEQGHHFDLLLSRGGAEDWIDELEAFAFQLNAYEHIAKHYNRDFGVHGVVGGVFRMDFLLRSSERFDPRSCPYRHTCGRNAIVPLFSSGFGSFGEFWAYIHNSSHERIMRDYQASLGSENQGKENLNRAILDLEGPDRYYGPAETFFRSLEFARFEKLSPEVMHSGTHSALFVEDRVILHDLGAPKDFTLSCFTEGGKFEANLSFFGKHLHLVVDKDISMRIGTPIYESAREFEIRNSAPDAGRYLALFRSAFARFINGMENEGFAGEAEAARTRVNRVFSRVSGLL